MLEIEDDCFSLRNPTRRIIAGLWLELQATCCPFHIVTPSLFEPIFLGVTRGLLVCSVRHLLSSSVLVAVGYLGSRQREDKKKEARQDDKKERKVQT